MICQSNSDKIVTLSNYLFQFVGLILTGRGVGDVLSEKQYKLSTAERTRKNAAAPDVIDTLQVPPVLPLFLNDALDIQGQNGNIQGSPRQPLLTPRAAEVQRIMHERASMFDSSQEASSQLFAEL